MKKVYAIDVMGSDKSVFVPLEDLPRILAAINGGARMIRVGEGFVNPASISQIRRAWDANVGDTGVDKSLDELLSDGIMKLK